MERKRIEVKCLVHISSWQWLVSTFEYSPYGVFSRQKASSGESALSHTSAQTTGSSQNLPRHQLSYPHCYRLDLEWCSMTHELEAWAPAYSIADRCWNL